MALKFRRGTTAQQSGSLAFGEPYVNTTLGTLLVGGNAGDIVLAVAGTGSTGTFGTLNVSGDATIGGNLTLGGTITIGDANTDNVVVNADLSSSLIPNNDNAFDLGSASARYRNLYATSISGAIAATNGVVSGSSQVISILTSLNTFSGSQLTQNTNLATISGSLILSASNLTQRVAANEAVSGTFARTNSANIFTGNQTITGSLYVSQDLVVAGSSSIQNISSSNVVIGASYVTLNAFNPASRFAGLKIYDSGSTAATASIVWDSLNNKVLYQHPSGADSYNSAWLISGPANVGALGSETGLTINKIQKATDDDHIGDSQITDDGTTVSIAGNLDLTGSMKSAQLTAIATITGSLITSQSVDQSRFTTLATYTGSVETRFTTLASYTCLLYTSDAADD